ncbi:MAG: DUF4874 domain-containing protein [Agriterribacter sp.]
MKILLNQQSRFVFSFLPVLFVISSGAQTGVSSQNNGGQLVEITPLSNPDRGFHLEAGYFAHNLINPFNRKETYPDGFIDKRIAQYQCKSDSLTLTQLYIYLTEWVDKDISPEGLQHIQMLFDGLKGNGYKAIVRFAYNYTGLNTSGGESQQWILRHIEQLRPVIKANIGVIAAVQAGFIGAWGEWHTSPLQQKQHAKNAIINALLDALPDGHFVEIRYPDLKNAVTFANAAYQRRVGYANDYFTAGEHSHAPGNDFVPGSAWYKQVERESPGLFVSGEIPYAEQSEWGLFKLINTDATLQILRDHHYSAFDITQNFELNINSWKNVAVNPDKLRRLHILFSEDYFKNDNGLPVQRSFYDFVRDHLGYRLNVTGSSVAAKNGKLQYDIKLTNTGFSTVLNPREVYLVCINNNGDVVKEIKLDVDPMTWQPFDPAKGTYEVLTHTLSGTATAELTGKYRVGIWMPDPGEQRYDSRYDIKLAPSKMVYHWWDTLGKYAVNIIGEVTL